MHARRGKRNTFASGAGFGEEPAGDRSRGCEGDAPATPRPPSTAAGAGERVRRARPGTAPGEPPPRRRRRHRRASASARGRRLEHLRRGSATAGRASSSDGALESPRASAAGRAPRCMSTSGCASACASEHVSASPSDSPYPSAGSVGRLRPPRITSSAWTSVAYRFSPSFSYECVRSVPSTSRNEPRLRILASPSARPPHTRTVCHSVRSSRTPSLFSQLVFVASRMRRSALPLWSRRSSGSPPRFPNNVTRLYPWFMTVSPSVPAGSSFPSRSRSLKNLVSAPAPITRRPPRRPPPRSCWPRAAPARARRSPCGSPGRAPAST